MTIYTREMYPGRDDESSLARTEWTHVIAALDCDFPEPQPHQCLQDLEQKSRQNRDEIRHSM